MIICNVSTFVLGDVIGCGVIFLPSNPRLCSVFFTYNGCEIGRVRCVYTDGGLFPSVTLTSNEDKVSVRLMETFKPRQVQVDTYVHTCVFTSMKSLYT